MPSWPSIETPSDKKKMYHRLLFHIFDLAVVQSWVLYVKDCEHERIPKASMLSLLQFKLNIAECMLKENKSLQKKRGRPSLEVEPQLQIKKKKGPAAVVSPLPVRSDNFAHWPLAVENKGRCKFLGCKGFSRVMCEKCNLHLCLTQKSNGFKRFHQP